MSQEETYTKAEDVDVASTIAHLLDYEDADGDTLENMDKPVPLAWIVNILQGIWETQGLFDQ